MLARVAERRMLSIRAMLLLAWMVLIASLVWDPFSRALTDPGHGWSPFRVGGDAILVQGQPMRSEPYRMGNRIFWTMAVPVLPLFLMVFGHEAWRRICPLSFASQLPRYLGWRRSRSVLQRRTGRVERLPVLIRSNSWAQRNAWYVQTGLLYVGLCSRILFINSNPIALAIALSGVILAAITVGALWGGKTWCNYVCPANIVQRIYTGPRGILESRPHLARTPISQSMCRTSSAGTEKSACVACVPLCGDIDLEKSYWDGLQAPYRRNVYYIFFGLIVGFYGYYDLYAGSWDYYFSGIWTHEPGQLGQILKPGLYIGGRALPIPKLLAVPVVLGAAGGLALVVGKLLEAAYRRVRRARGSVGEAEIVHHCLCFSAYVSINTLYVFGGRPNLALLPNYGIRSVDLVIVFLTTIWFWQALQRSPLRYRRESLATSLIEQLRKLRVDISKHFEGRTVEQLKPDEVYVLAKVLPDISHANRITAYRNVLDEAISAGKTDSAQFLETLADLRGGMQISDEEHLRILDELGVPRDIDLDAQRANSDERAMCIANYGEMIGGAIAAQIEQGRALGAVLASAELQRTVTILRASFQINDADHEVAIEVIRGNDGVLARQLDMSMDQLKRLLAARFCVLSSGADDPFWNALARLIVRIVNQRCERLYGHLFSILDALSDRPTCHVYARWLRELDEQMVSHSLQRLRVTGLQTTWRERLDERLVAALEGRTPPAAGVDIKAPAHSYRDIIRLSHDRSANLDLLLQDPDPIAAALTLTAFAYIDPDLARGRAEALALTLPADGHWLLRATVAQLAAAVPAAVLATASRGGTRIVLVQEPHAPVPVALSSGLSHIAVGRAPGNDVTINHALMAPYHLVLHRAGDDMTLMRLDDAPLLIAGVVCPEDTTRLRRGAVLSFLEDSPAALALHVEWDAVAELSTLQHYDPATKLVWLSRASRLHGLDLAALARLCRHADIDRHRYGTLIVPPSGGASLLFMQTGTAAILDAESLQRTADDVLLQGEIFLADGKASVPDGGGKLRIESPFAIVLTVREPETMAALITDLQSDSLDRRGPRTPRRTAMAEALVTS